MKGKGRRRARLARGSRRGRRPHGLDAGDDRERGDQPVATASETRFWSLRLLEEIDRRPGKGLPLVLSRDPVPEGASEGPPPARPREPSPSRARRSIPLVRDEDRDEPAPSPVPALPSSPRGAIPGDPPSAAAIRADDPREVASVLTPPEMLEHLERLDRVVHDFVASLGPEASAGPAAPACPSAAGPLIRLLERMPASKGQVLGPPVLLGASPAIRLESLLGLLGSLRKTGILRVQADGATYMVSVVNGDVVHGVCSPRPEADLLGNILVARGIVDCAELGRFFETCGSSASKIGDALDRQLLVSTEQLREALEHQMQRLFDRLFNCRRSEWCFHEGEATLAYVDMRVNVVRVILESARNHDERGRPLGSGVARSDPPSDE